ncbi:MAG: alpha/beta hydrolase [Planctomycetaceae bacterium]|nr:alpha/beta hydrolase [Planctomycetaceae bacterium]MBQ2820331.1 alpha/beta hydrolase [Thermoguttaceae bacterium]
MKRLLGTLSLFCLFNVCVLLNAFGFEKFNVWPDTPPKWEEGQAIPVLEWWTPENKTSDACLIIAPGGAYMGVAYDYEGVPARDFFLKKGVTVVMLRYRVPRPKAMPKHMSAWQDAQRAVRFVRAHAQEWGINPEKIGFMGFSAGGHLTLMTATTSLTPAYEPVDELDKVPCHVNFAVPIYPAYVLKDGADGTNAGKGNDSEFVADFAFDEKTPIMCLIHGDGDGYSPMGSVSVYHKLRTMNIPAEIHVYALANHAFRNCKPEDPMMFWKDRVYAWMKVMKIAK